MSPLHFYLYISNEFIAFYLYISDEFIAFLLVYF